MAAQAHNQLREALAGHPSTWHHLLGALNELSDQDSPESVTLMRDLASFGGRFTLDPSAEQSHAVPPEEALRSIALQRLAAWDRERHRDVLEEVANAGTSEYLRHVARGLLAS